MSTTINATTRERRIVASQLRPGDRIIRAGRHDHRERGVVVTAVFTNRGMVQPFGTTREHSQERILFHGLHPDLPLVVWRAADA